MILLAKETGATGIATDKGDVNKQQMQPLRIRLCFPNLNQPTLQPQMEIRHPKQVIIPFPIDRLEKKLLIRLQAIQSVLSYHGIL